MAGFHMIANDRRRSQRELFPYNRRQSQTIAEPTVAIYTFCSAEMSNLLVRYARGKIRANNMADIEEEIPLQANIFLFLVLKRRQHQLQNRRKHRKIFMKRQDRLNFSPIFSQLLAFLFLSLKFLLLRL